MINPIETIYNGYRFRSRLEARWAVFFDALGIKYRYEPEGFLLGHGNNIKYLPDFWLPEHHCWVEIKPYAPSKEEEKKAYFLSLQRKEQVYIFFGDIEVPSEKTESAYSYHRPIIWFEHPNHSNIQRIKNKNDLADLFSLSEEEKEPLPPEVEYLTTRIDVTNKLSFSSLDVVCGLNRMGLEVTTHNKEIDFIDMGQRLPETTETLRKVSKAHIECCEPDLYKLLTSRDGWIVKAEQRYDGPGYHWVECPECHKIGILHKHYCNNYVGLLCECSQFQNGPFPQYDTPRLQDAYIAARQARFEYGENGR